MKDFRNILVLVAVLHGSLILPAESRELGGRLGLIRLPNNGVPVITTPGASFQVTLTEEATLALTSGGASYGVSPEWTLLPNGLMQAQCTVPDATPSGEYALDAATGEQEDSNLRSVYILEAIPESYTVAHITDTHIGTTRHPRDASAIIGDVIEATNASDATFVLITGDLTENGEMEQFQQFLDILDGCKLPTFVISGNHDRQSRNYEDFFGPLTYAFWFGNDGYLAFDTKDYIVADELGEQDGLLHFYRRQLKSARWSIGFTHRYELTMGVRAQLILFVDDPLDYLIYGHYHREAGDQDGIPWGQTAFIMTPAAINGEFRLIAVDDQGLHAQETIHAASITLEEEALPVSDSIPASPVQ